MAKQVQILVICDVCKKKWQDGDEEAPSEKEWSWGGTAYVVECCEPCMIDLRERLRFLFTASEPQQKRTKKSSPTNRARLGPQPPRGFLDKYKNEAGDYVCPFTFENGLKCGRPFGAPQHLGNHHSRGHGTPLE